MNRIHALLFFASVFLQLLKSDFAVGQERCGTVAYEAMMNSAVKLKKEQQFEQWMLNKINENKMRVFQTLGTQSVSYKIPVVVHVIHNGETVGAGTNISEAQILSQIQVMNDDFKRLNADAVNTPSEFLPFAGSIDIEFVMAKQDPNGFASNGITRTKGNKTSYNLSDNATYKALNYWPAEDYFNIWVVNFSGGLLGYAQLPTINPALLGGLEDSSTERLTDGITIHYRVFGSGSEFDLIAQFNKGRTATHEAGHFFGLRHIWGDDNCATDYVNDTPKQTTNSAGCPDNPQASCDIPAKPHKMFQNFMDYTNDMCMNIFTQNQADRMDIVMQNSVRRSTLPTSHGLNFPPGFSNDLGISEVLSPGLVMCESTPAIKLLIKNFSTTPITSFSIRRVLNGSTPVIQEFSNVSIGIGDEQLFQLNPVTVVTGKNDISLTILSPNGLPDSGPANNSKTFRTYLDQSTDTAPLRINFDQEGEKSWFIAPPIGAQPWKSVITNKSNSLVYEGYNNSTLGEESWFVSPVLDFSNNTNNSLFFDLSYGQRLPAEDRLKVLVSYDCGLTYSETIFDQGGNDFRSAVTSSPWVPTVNADWKQQYLIINQLSGKKNIRLAIVAANQHGNNLYIDNLEIFADSSPTPPIPTDQFRLYYTNRSSLTDIALSFNLPVKKDVRLQIFSLMGQIVADNMLPETINQTYYFDLGVQARGIYLFRLQIDQQVTTTKVFIGH
ncbi:MAG: T9SS type A sorting domain-containing protein [Cyclobacteriaceae bacterium]|nr:T9SS type A sorting domain-containing protein [Cyclobacteriaceae bacterium]